MLTVLLLTLAIVLVAVVLLGVRVFFVKGGRFPNTHIDGNAALRKKGIHCAAHQDAEARRHNSF